MSKLRLRQVNNKNRKSIGNDQRASVWMAPKEEYYGSGSEYEIYCVVTASSLAVND